LILRKIIKTASLRMPVLRLKCTQIDFGWGSAEGAYGAPLDWEPLAGIMGT